MGAAPPRTTWLAPSPEDRAREMDRRTRPAMRVAGGCLAVLALLATVSGGPWALVALLALLVPPLFPRVVPRDAAPEAVELAVGLCLLGPVVVGAGLTGGPLSPLAVMVVVSGVIGAARNTFRGALVTNVVAGVTLSAVTFLSRTAEADELPLLAGLLVAMLATSVMGQTLVQVETRYRRASLHDGLTGLLNRGAFDRRFAELREHAVLHDEHLAVVLFDLDRFKAVNDEHGHATGDAVLRAVAEAAQATLRRTDLVFRWGGEELLALLPGADAADAARRAEGLRAAIAALDVGGVRPTASFGVASRRGAGVLDGSLVADADRALYAAKAAGRDRVV